MNIQSESLPRNLDAERAVLGGLLQRPERFVEIADWLQAEDFFRHEHRLIYQGIGALLAKDVPVDAVTVIEWFESMGKASQVDNGAYVVEIAATFPSAANLLAYAEIVQERSLRRKLVAVGADLLTAASDPAAGDVGDIAQDHQRQLRALVPSPRLGPVPARACLDALYDDLVQRFEHRSMPGMPTPWAELNQVTHGLQDGEVIVLAARSNMGKSALGFQLSAFSALSGRRTLRFSMEMTKEQATRRDLAAYGGIPHAWLLDPREGDYWGLLTESMRAFRDAPLSTDDSPRLTTSQIATRAEREHLHAPLRLVLVDHLHEVKLPGKQGEVIERADALRDLKALAKRLGCPMVVLAQLNRGAASAERPDARRPRLTDLRGSGGIEEVADVVLFLHRPDYYDPADMPGLIEVTVGKGRDIPTGKTICLRNRFDVMRADDWDGPMPVARQSRQPARGFHPDV